MNQGTVKFFNDAKGYGFIADKDSGRDYFVHVSGLVDEIRKDDSVSFEIEEGKRGPQAVNVKLIR